MSGGFFGKVYGLVCLIPPAKVATYGQIAMLLGHPQAARTVGWALHSLSDEQAQVVPWQRVINSRGTISFRPGSPGAAMQQALLEEEGVVFDEKGRVDLKVYGWEGLDPVQIESGDFEQPPQEPTQLRLW